jgi:hypothetical protein
MFRAAQYYCLPRARRLECPFNRPEDALELNDRLKRLMRELGHAINDAVSDSDRVANTLAEVRTSGFDIVVKLDATIGLARREPNDRITANDRRFLESLRIRVDDEIEEETQNTTEMRLTPQDIRFLKSLKISMDEDS